MYLWRGMDFDARFEGMDRGRAQGERDFGVSLLWIFDAVRHLDPSWGDRVAEKAARLRERNVVAIGIGGDERRGPAERFRNMYLFAREHGLRRTAHGGETTGPESIADALDLLGAERIGHGLSAWRDEALLERLVREQVPIEVCLTSNLRTGCCTSLEEHPLRRYYDAGVKVVLNTDDPAMFGTTLGREYQMAQDCFGFSDEELARLARNGFEASFLPEQKKAELAARVHAGEASAARVVGDRRGPRMNVEQQK
jgi:adenosine deaminase/aminodeoxyfutalosine deaminase